MGRLREEDFEVLRGSLESGRQSPSNISFVLIISIFLQSLLYGVLSYLTKGETLFPNHEKILSVHLWLTIILSVFSIIYSIPAVYRKSSRIQYLLSILVTHNMSTFPFLLLSLFLLGTTYGVAITSTKSLLMVTYVILSVGLFILISTCIRFYILLKKGQYRKGSKKDEQRSKLESLSFLPGAIAGGVGVVFVIQYLAKNSAFDDSNFAILIVGGILTFFVMMFILPEQLVILYCKYKYKSFNFNERGYLYSSEDQKVKRKRGIEA